MALRRRITSVDAPALRAASVRTRAIRWLLVAAAVGLLAAAYLSARGLRETQSEVVPGGAGGVAILDLSVSITDADYVNVGNALQELVDTGPEMGLVVFSDVPYELLPPHTPARELRPLLRFLERRADGSLPPSPWTDSFQSGTRISSALELARQMLRRERIETGSILLVSDLQTSPDDLGALGEILRRLRASQTTVRVLPLAPTAESVRLFASLLGEEALVDPLDLGRAQGARIDSVLRGDAPLVLVLLAGLVFAVLAVHERYGSRLALPRGAGVRA